MYIGDDQGTIWVTQSADEEYDDNCVILTFQQSLLQVMIWGCIMAEDKGPVVVFEYPGGRCRGLNAERYHDQVLEKALYDYWVEKSEEKGLVLFQQDGARSHTAKSMKAWLAQNSIKLFPHPVSSPDLSPIEPLWKRFKTIIQNCPHLQTSIGELKAAVHEA